MYKSESMKAGFTLAEVLVALAVVGGLLVAVVMMSGATLRYSRAANSVNALTADANDAAGYLALNARRALRGIGCQSGSGLGTVDNPSVNCPQDSSVRITSGASSFDCNVLSADGPCIALIVPVVDRNSPTAQITGYEMLAYRIVALEDWSGNPGLPEGWAGESTPVMLEYRAPLVCGSPCTLPSPPTSAVATRESLVISDLYFEDASGNAIAPFSLQTDSNNSANLDLLSTTFRFRLRSMQGDADRIVPANHTLSVTATSRP